MPLRRADAVHAIGNESKTTQGLRPFVSDFSRFQRRGSS